MMLLRGNNAREDQKHHDERAYLSSRFHRLPPEVFIHGMQFAFRIAPPMLREVIVASPCEPEGAGCIANSVQLSPSCGLAMSTELLSRCCWLYLRAITVISILAIRFAVNIKITFFQQLSWFRCPQAS